MNSKAAALSALIVLLWSPVAAAGPVADAAARAEALQAEGKTVEALEALDEAADAIWVESPLAFRKVLLVDSSDGYGVYSERADAVFRADDKMMIYVEPVGYGYGATGGAASIDLNVDLSIENATGQVLGESKDVFKFSAETWPNRREFGMTLSFGAPYYRPGDYKAIFNVRDQNSDKTGTFEVPFTIAAPEAAGGSGEAPKTTP